MSRLLFLLCLLVHHAIADLDYDYCNLHENEDKFIFKEVETDCVYCFKSGFEGIGCLEDGETFYLEVGTCLPDILSDSLTGKEKEYSLAHQERIIEELDKKINSSLYTIRSFHLAVMLNKRSTIEYMINKNVTDINEKDDYGFSPFLVASATGRLEILKLLLQKGADIKATDCLGNTGLHVAVQKSNNSEVINYLVEQLKLDVNLKNLENQTALHLVTYNGNMPVVEYLVANGAQVDAMDKNNDMPLHIAAAYGYLEPLELFLNKVPKSLNAVDNYNRTALIVSTWFHEVEVMNYLLKQNGLDLDQQDIEGKTAMHYACHNNFGNENTFEGKTRFELLIQKPLSYGLKDNKGKSVFVKCFASQKWSDVKTMLEKGAELDILHKDEEGWTLLHTTAKIGNPEMAQMLLKLGADIDLQDHYGFTPTMISVYHGRLEMLEFFVSQNARLDLRTNSGKTLFHLAGQQDDPEIIQFLLKVGLDVEARDEDGRTPLHISTISSMVALKELVKVGANVNAKDNNETTPLHLAAKKVVGKTQPVKFLIENGADVYTTNNAGKAPIHEFFTDWDSYSAMSELVRAGSNLLGKDNMGQTAFSLAMTPLDEENFYYSDKLAIQNILNRIKDDMVTLDTISVTVSQNFTTDSISAWNFQLYDADEKLMCTTESYTRFVYDNNIWMAGERIEFRDVMDFEGDVSIGNFGDCFENFTFSRNDPPTSLWIEMRSWIGYANVDKLQVQFFVGPNPTQIYEAVNVGESKEDELGNAHIKAQLFLVLSEKFCCQKILVKVTKPELRGEYYLNYQKSNRSLKVYVRATKPEILLFKSDNMEWTFGSNINDTTLSISGSADAKCPIEIADKKEFEISCQKYPGRNETQIEGS